VPCLLEPVTEDPNIHIWVIETVGRPPAYELILKHGEQTRRNFSERYRFLDDSLTANKLVRKGGAEEQADFGVAGMGRRIAAIADTGRTLAELMSANVAFRPDTNYIRSLPESIFLLLGVYLIFRNLNTVWHCVNEEVLVFLNRRFGLCGVLANSYPAIISPHIREKLASLFCEVVNNAEHIRKRQEQTEVLEVVQDLGVLKGNQRLLEEVGCAAIIDFKVELASCLFARRADRVQFDVIDVAIVTNAVVDPQPEGLVLARATSYAGIALLNDVEPVLFAVEKQVIRGTSDTARRGNGFISQESQLKLVALAFRALGKGSFHVVYGTIPASCKPANAKRQPVAATELTICPQLIGNSAASFWCVCHGV
jgi:hypothetical protein